MKKIIFLTATVIFTIGVGLELAAQNNEQRSQEILSPEAETLEKGEALTQEVIGFLPYWMLANSEFIRYQAVDEIVYFGLHIDETGEFIKLQEDGTSELGWLNWKKSTNLERVISNAKRHEVRVSLAVVMQDNNTIESFLNCPTCWNTLIRNTLNEMAEKKVANLNLDFEWSGITPNLVRSNFTEFVTLFTHQVHNVYPRGIVTVDAHANSAQRNRLHNIAELSSVVDKLFIMSYDFHQLSEEQTGPLAPIGGAPDKFRYDLITMLNDYARFIDKNKLILGVAYYGHYWITENDTLGSFRVPGNEAIGYSNIQYYKGCAYHPENKGEAKRWDEDAQSPWFVFYDEEKEIYRQCHYEDVKSLQSKYHLAKDWGLGGIGIWALGYDGDQDELWNLLEEEF